VLISKQFNVSVEGVVDVVKETQNVLKKSWDFMSLWRRSNGT
jgi:hypothetical protein